MTIGPATLLAIVAAVLATLLWWIAARIALPAWVGMLLFGIGLAVVILAGPLIKLP
jgi:Kef-type K+ transport system membrane component KefB